jgi:hypothetical protein
MIDFGTSDQSRSDIRLELCSDNKRDTQTLLPLIEKHVALTHSCKGDDKLDEYPLYNHLKVNHSINFVDADTLASTQHIE